MLSIFLGSLLISVLHAIIPNHWLPVLAIGRKQQWTLEEVTRVTLLSGLAHALSTIVIGIGLGMLGLQLAQSVQSFTHYVAPTILILLGFFFIYQHHRHKHFHLHQAPKPTLNKKKLIGSLVLAMFLSPCLEIEAYFLLAGSEGWWAVLAIAVTYFLITVTGMVLWVRLAYRGLLKMNWHAIEHKAGIITGWTLVLTGILSFFIS
jgi:putative Mn2+ efflux pump MntP